MVLTFLTFLTITGLADAVLDWTALMLDAIRLENTGPTLSTRNLAILHTAIYDAVNSIERTHQPYRFYLDPPAGASAEAVAVAAAFVVALDLYPSVSGRAQELYATYVANMPATPLLTNSLAFGTRIGQLALQSRSDDGSTTLVPYIPSDAPGQWRRTPPFFRPPLDPQWRYVKPFCLPAVEPFVPPGPPPMVSQPYTVDFNQVKELGARYSATRTPEQSQIAVFWSDFSYTAMPPGHWHEIAMTIAINQGNSLAQNARLFALLSLAQADAAIVCWETKYRFNSWRPITAIQRADEDGNPATAKATNWISYLVAPNFPEYTSGHSTFSKASANIITDFYGTDAIPFTATSDSLPGVYRNFTSLAACADEIGMSRIYGGIHFMSANRDGKACGARIADYITRNFLLPNHPLPRLSVETITNGTSTLRLLGNSGRPCVLEVSTNLMHWRTFATNSVPLGGWVLHTTPTPAAPQSFYRAREY